MSADVKKIEELRNVTGKDYSSCEKALKKSKNDFEKAKKYIYEKDRRREGSISDNIYRYVTGTRKVNFAIRHKEEALFDIPVYIPILILLIIPARTYFVGIALLLLILLDCSLFVYSEEEEKKELKAVKANKTDEKVFYDKGKSVVKVKEEINIEHITKDENAKVRKDKDGYVHLSIQ